MGKTQLPPGLRFHPTSVELIMYYLKRKVLGKKLHFKGIVEVDIYKHAPWDLPDKSGWRSGDLKWYFFCPRAKKYAIGSRMSRSTDLGYWKTSGKDRSVSYNDKVVGMIRTLIFYRGKAPKGDRTDWVMYEYRLEEKEFPQDYVLCEIFQKDGLGPRNGAQYGARFREEDWDDDSDEDEEVDGGGGQAVSAEISVPAIVVPTTQNSPVPSSAVLSEINGEGSLVSCPSAALPCATPPYAPEVVPPFSNSCINPLEALQFMHEDDISAMLSIFDEEGGSIPNENDKNKVVDRANVGGDVGSDPYYNGIGIYDDLGDVESLTGWLEPGDNMTNCYNSIYQEDQMCSAQFMELTDLDAPLDVSSEPQGCSYMQAGDLYASNNFCNNSGQLFNSTASSMATHSSPSTQLPGWSYSLNHMVNASSQDNSAGADANQGCDIYQAAASFSEYPTFFHGTPVQRPQSEQSERRGGFHHSG